MKKEEVFAYAPHYEKLEANAEKIGFVPCKDLKGLTAKADTLVMACKPYQIEGVLSEIKEELKGKALISIAAGWNYDKYEKYLDKSRFSGSVISYNSHLLITREDIREIIQNL